MILFGIDILARCGRRCASVAVASQGGSWVMDEAEFDALAYRKFPIEHRRQLHSTNPLERLNGEVMKRTRVVGIFPNEAVIVRLVGAVLLEQNDEWAVTRRYTSLESFARISHDRASEPAALTAD